MVNIPEKMALLDVLASYTRSGLLFCLMVQMVSIMLGKIFNKPTLQRLSIAITCTFAAFSAASYASNSHVGWVVISVMTFFALLVVTLIVRTLFTKFVGLQGLQHASPSVHFGDGYQLSAAFPWMEQFLEIKDRSSRSFPGDHASILLLWMGFLSLFTQGKQRILVLAIGVFFILPRLIAGAHWLSDNLVGGGFIVLQTLAWGYYSALGSKLCALLERLAQPVFHALQHLPLLNKL